jgi:hypothetical protein
VRRKGSRLEKLENLQGPHLEDLSVDGIIVHNTLEESV